MTGKVADYHGHPFSGDPQTWNLEEGAKLARVWNHADGNARGYGATSWNPRRLPRDDDSAGRFDPFPPNVDGEGYVYGSESKKGEKVAILETFRSLMHRDHSKSGIYTCARVERNRRSLTIFEVPSPITIVNINMQRGRECFRMDEEVLYVHDREKTREWAEAIKSGVDTASGIAYNSTRESVPENRRSFIIWQDRVPFKGFREFETVNLGTAKGRAMVDQALEDYHVTWL